MKFEEINRQLDESIKPVPLPKFKLGIRASDPVSQILVAMRKEIVTQLILMFGFLIIFPIMMPMYELPRAVYLILMFIISLYTLTYIFKLNSFRYRNANFDANTRDLLKDFIRDARQTIEGYESYVNAGCALLPICIFTLLTGNEYFVYLAGDRVFEQWFLLRMDTLELVGLVSGYLVVYVGFICITKGWSHFLYGRQITRLETLLFELEELPNKKTNKL